MGIPTKGPLKIRAVGKHIKKYQKNSPTVPQQHNMLLYLQPLSAANTCTSQGDSGGRSRGARASSVSVLHKLLSLRPWLCVPFSSDWTEHRKSAKTVK